MMISFCIILTSAIIMATGMIFIKINMYQAVEERQFSERSDFL